VPFSLHYSLTHSLTHSRTFRETGLDASPAYDPAFHVYVTEVNESSWRSLYPQFIELCESYKFLYQWNVSEILERKSAPEEPHRVDTWFVMKVLY
jgi:hypothetical protein